MTRWLAALAFVACACGPVFARDEPEADPQGEEEEQGDKQDKKDKKEKDKPEFDTTSDEAVALADKLAIDPKFKNGEVHLEYQFDDVNEGGDWTGRGLQVFNIGSGGGDFGARSFESMYMGAKNQWGLVLHSLDLVGDYTIIVTCEMPRGGAVTRNTSFAILLGFKKKPSIGLLWGTQIVKVKKGFGMKPLSKRPAEPFQNTRKMKVKIVRKGAELTLYMNGRKIGSKQVKGKDLDGKLGFLCKDVQMTIHDVSIVGTPDVE